MNFLRKIIFRGDLAIPVLLIAIIFMMILPIPTELVDILIGSNIAMSVILLMSAVYMKSPLELVSFPTILLLTTIFRLALSITTTRLILLEGDAGAIVETFGAFVVGGDLAVGIVIFSIITIVQFIVITKGSERIAEVAARFSLDGMPGKQMSIDADLRAGLVDHAEVRIRREEIQKESQLYGSMDGAMKFVKGDAIAGIIIIFVNIIGGISIGMFREGLEAAAAVHKYTILTVGDGLVAQIPALIISITAGMMVTRINSEDSKDVGTDIINQISAKPSAIFVGAVLLLLFAAIPGFPTLLILGLSSGLFYAGWALTYKKTKNEAAVLGSPESFNSSLIDADGNLAPRLAKGEKAKEGGLTVPIMIEMHTDTLSQLTAQSLNHEMIQVRNILYSTLGIPMPVIQVRLTSNVTYPKYAVLLHEVPVEYGITHFNKYGVNYGSETLKKYRIPYEKDELIAALSWVDQDQEEKLKKMNIQYITPLKGIGFHFADFIRRNAESFITIQEGKLLSDMLEKDAAEISKELNRNLPLGRFTEILKRLVSESVSIRNLRVIAETLINWAPKEKDIILLTEHCRCALSRQISHAAANEHHLIPCFLLSEEIEELFRKNIRNTSAGTYCALPNNVSAKIIEFIKHHEMAQPIHSQKPVIVTHIDIRRYVRKVIDNDFPHVHVLSYQEIHQDFKVTPIDHIRI